MAIVAEGGNVYLMGILTQNEAAAADDDDDANVTVRCDRSLKRVGGGRRGGWYAWT